MSRDRRAFAPFAAGLVDAALVQRHAFAGDLLAQRRVVLAGDRSGAGAETLRSHGCTDLLVVDDLATLLTDGVGAEWDAIVWLDDVDDLGDATRRESLLDALTREAARGIAVVVSLPGAEGLATAQGTTGGATYEDVLAASARFPGAVLLLQAAAEGSLLRRADAAPQQPLATELVLPDRLEPEHAEHFMIVAGLADAVARLPDSATLRAAVAPVFVRRIRSLEAANANLLETNARLGRGAQSHSGPGAITILTQLRAATERAEAVTAAAQEQATAATLRSEQLEARAVVGEQHAQAQTERAVAAERRVVELELRAADAERRVYELEARAGAAEHRGAELEAQLSELRNRRSLRAADRLKRLLRQRRRAS
ncbi:hypothetical protein [Conexibacter sp. CPCC 206217]|uniref:hypothetical protein n=1 Tax=Conexibacter sp. CPCC 206217 TaxID=3064574 RepID=UPI002724C6F8|nr:hypothetical protein [Conexibacter sp. CPCC 206217]MDO8210000.1 hypothetical protein [Conexibacter sp. CPCC 206217]